MKVADRLARLLDQRVMKRSDLARLTGLDPAQVSRFLSGERKPNAAQFFSLCAALGIDPKVAAEGTLDAGEILGESNASAEDLAQFSTAMARLATEHQCMKAERDGLKNVLESQSQVYAQQLQATQDQLRRLQTSLADAEARSLSLRIENQALASRLESALRQCQTNYEVAMKFHSQLEGAKSDASNAKGIAAVAGVASFLLLLDRGKPTRTRRKR